MCDSYVLLGAVGLAAFAGTVLGQTALGLIAWAVVKVQDDWERVGR